MEENLYISQDGYMETFLVNETSEDVWFDNMMLMSMSSPIAQETHYDPWGLELTGIGFQYGGIKANKYLYNGKELIEDAGLQYYDYGARMYDPTIGRWGVVDPAADVLEISSPFVYSLNNPTNYVDLDGELPIFINGKVGSDSERANKDYWNAQLLSTIKNSGIANPGGEIHFVDGDKGLVSIGRNSASSQTVISNK
ncbi:RHS repeat-associated core domain-containing protein, partial [Algoriphagus boritolerans]|uniref:RHS repeat domain-containing protein n=1 Tax=Algoriphagus boritolerans TaxID=308111 RepID=UPI000B107F95